MKRTIVFLLTTLFAMHISAQKKVACVGNSVTFGATIEKESDKYPSQLQVLLGSGYEVKNFGHNSQCMLMTGRDLEETSRPGDCAYRNQDTYRRLLEYKPEIVILSLGSNDSKTLNWVNDPETRFRKDLNDMLDELIANSNPKIYLCYPIRVKTESWTINDPTIHIIIGIIKSVAEERGIDIINLHTAFEETMGAEWTKVYNDGVHPNALGAGIIAQRVAEAILENKLYDKENYLHPTFSNAELQDY